MSNLANSIIDGMLFHTNPSAFWIAGTITFDELASTEIVTQKSKETVFTHTMKVLDNLIQKNRITLWSALFHDIGKPCVFVPNNYSTFAGHEIESAKIAKTKLIQWGENPCIIGKVVSIVSTHMLDLNAKITEKMIRNFVASVGMDNVGNWFALRNADTMSYNNYDNYAFKFIKPFHLAVFDYIRDFTKNEKFELKSKPLSMSGSDQSSGFNSLKIDGGFATCDLD